VLLNPSSTQNGLITYLLMCAGSGLALWLYSKFGMIQRQKVALQEWHSTMLAMWWWGTALVLFSTIGVPVVLHGVGLSQEEALLAMVAFVMPWTLGFLVVSGFGMLIYAVLYQSLWRFFKFSQ